jgi:hypothetical protein
MSKKPLGVREFPIRARLQRRDFLNLNPPGAWQGARAPDGFGWPGGGNDKPRHGPGELSLSSGPAGNLNGRGHQKEPWSLTRGALPPCQWGARYHAAPA